MTIVCGKKYELSNSSDPSKVSALSNNEAMHSESSHAFDVYTNMSTSQTSKTSPITIMSEDLLGNEQEYQAIATDSANYCSRFSFCRKSSISHLLNNEIAAEPVPASNHQDDTFKQASGPLEGILPLETSSKASLNSNVRIKRSRRDLPSKAVAILKDWLLSPQHIEHPYPTNSDKEILMEKTGIGFKQLTNWFTNARKRIWMPLMRRRLPLRTSESLNAACTCEVGSCKQLYTWNEMVNTTLSPVSFSSAREQKAKKGWNDNQNLRTIRSFSESTCNLNEYDKKQFRKPEIVPSTSTDVSEPLKAERYRVHSTSLQLSDAEKLEECVTSHLYRSQRFPNRRELVNIAPEVGSGNGHVEDLLEMYSSPDGNRAPCDRKEQDDAAVPYALLVRSLFSLLILLPSKSIALFYRIERIEFPDKLIKISGNICVCSVEPIRHLIVRINVFCPKEQLQMIRLWFRYSKRTSCYTAASRTRKVHLSRHPVSRKDYQSCELCRLCWEQTLSPISRYQHILLAPIRRVQHHTRKDRWIYKTF